MGQRSVVVHGFLVRRGQVDEDSRDSRVTPVSLTGLRNWFPARGREAERKSHVKAPWAEARLRGPQEGSVLHIFEGSYPVVR